MSKLNVHSLETFGSHDGPGIRLVVFMQGCNFRCLYCQNPDTQAYASKEAVEMSAEEILNRLEKGRSYYEKRGGLTVSGGEPTLQTEGLIELFEQAKKAGFHTALDTNGGIYSPKVKRLYQLTDLLLLDVKQIDDEWHKQLVGGTNSQVLKNARVREEMGQPMWLRYVLVPGWSDQEELLHLWGQAFADFKTVEKVEILPYHKLGVYKYENLGMEYMLKDTPSPTDQLKEKTKKIFEEYFSNVEVR